MTHHLLDWRLALDMAEVTLQLDLNEDRWLGQAESLATTFSGLCHASDMNVNPEEAASLSAVVLEDSKALILCHPLWHKREGLATPRQIEAKEALRSKYGTSLGVDFCDIRQLAIRPQQYMLQLGQPDD